MKNVRTVTGPAFRDGCFAPTIAMIIVLALLASCREAAEPPADEPTAEPTIATAPKSSEPPSDSHAAERTDLPRWVAFETDIAVGRKVADLSWAEYLPEIIEPTRTGRCFIVLYMYDDPDAHEQFSRHFSERREETVYAIHVPPAPGTKVAGEWARDDLTVGPIDCADCVRMELPTGPIWLMDLPTLLIIEDGVVTCSAVDDFSACLDSD
jgi:hypothetical protein